MLNKRFKKNKYYSLNYSDSLKKNCMPYMTVIKNP